ncbi:penicillin-binding protein [Fusobacterium sp.]|uniref:penicillin-binding protein n=1 Tax=Fusobacterium sp. TaxID=68766 RepID=UPI00396C389F
MKLPGGSAVKYLKILVFILIITIIGYSFYSQQYLLTCFMLFFLIYFGYICWKKEEYRKTSNFNRRALYGSNIVLFFIFLIFMRLVQIQIFEREFFQNKVMGQINKTDILSGNRGTIYDSTGKRLAFNKNIYTVGINPSAIYDRTNTMNGIVQILNQDFIIKDKAVLLEEIKRGYEAGRKYKVVAKNITEREKEQLDAIVKKYGLTGHEIRFDRNIERTYYKNDVYDNIVGFIGYNYKSNSEKIGLFGLEREYEKYLKQKVLQRQNFYTRGRSIKLPIAKEFIRMNLNGNNIYTTIDNEIQFILSEELKKKFLSSKSDEAYGLVMDPNNGKILGAASFTTNKNKALRNPLFQNQFEPGSTFKPIVVASAMDGKLITKDTLFDVGNGRITKYGHTIRESSRSTRGVLNTQEVLKRSSNVGMVLIGDKFTDAEFEHYLKKFGLYDKTGVDFPGEIKPYTVPYKKWHGLKKSTMAFGQGIVVTPIQLITAFSAVINGGVLYKPYLVEKITDESDIIIRRNIPTQVRRVVSEDISRQLRGILEDVVADGTARRGQVEGYRVGGKTGTAQLSGKGGYLKDNYLASFIGFFPADKPKYVILVMFLKPKGETIFEKYGGATAAPVFADIVKRITKTKNILSQDISNITEIKEVKSGEANGFVDIEMPDLTGFSPKDVIYIFKNTDIEIKIEGAGLVDKQFPAAGTSLEDVKEVRIILK